MMRLIEERAFAHQGKDFTMRCFATENGYKVMVFLGSQQVSPSYGVDIETHRDFFTQHQTSRVEQLFDIARSDVERGIYFTA